jgi:hypothetical protein
MRKASGMGRHSNESSQDVRFVQYFATQGQNGINGAARKGTVYAGFELELVQRSAMGRDVATFRKALECSKGPYADWE